MTVDRMQESVRRRYAELAVTATEGGTCCSPDEQQVFGASCYDPDHLGELPGTAVAASLGCASSQL